MEVENVYWVNCYMLDKIIVEIYKVICNGLDMESFYYFVYFFILIFVSYFMEGGGVILYVDLWYKGIGISILVWSFFSFIYF